MQDDAGQKEGIVENGGGLKIPRQQPANFKDMLVKPAFDLAEYEEQSRHEYQRKEELQTFQNLPAFLSFCDGDQFGKVVDLEGCPTDQCAVDVCLRHELGHVIGLHTAAILDADRLCDVVPVEIRQCTANGSTDDALGNLTTGVSPRADSPDRLIGKDDIRHVFRINAI